ncbi:MAG: trimeric intracellular cation channel family protein [Nitrosopumilus sp.]|nr:MAG: trimeric intracellular cation channel family protein [Nitrosopumilus sp.]
MDPHTFSVEFFIYILDVFGTAAFAVTGAFKAIEHDADIIGIVILAIITGVAGGTIRDVLFKDSLPNSIVDPTYVIVALTTAIVIFLLHSRLKKHWNLFLKFDAIGLGIFTMIGAMFAYTMFGLDFLAISVSGILTAIGGGILRDVFVNNVPIVFVKEFYASASFVGIVIFYLILLVSDQLYFAVTLGMAITIGLRLVAMKYNWNLPKIRKNS